MATLLVTSRDGAVFRVNTDPRSALADQRYAAAQTAEALERHGAFHRVRSLDDIVEPETAPSRPRPQLTLIRGGKS